MPQLFNVPQGRHECGWPTSADPNEVEAYELRHRKRLDMKPD